MSVLPGQLNSGSGSGDSAGGDDPATPLMKGKGENRLADELSTAERHDRYKKHEKADLELHVVASASKAVQQSIPAILMERGRFVISPRVWYMRYWDLATIVLLLYTAVVTPVEVAFIPTKLNILFWVNRGVDACFLVDIFFNFFLAIPDPLDGQLVYHHPTIIRTYLKGWFIIDVISILPFDLVSIIFNNGAVSKLKILRAMRLLRLMKLLRILRAGRIFQRLETLYTIDYSALELVKFGILALTCSHWMACAWGLVADLEDEPHNWLKYTSFNQYTEEGLLKEGQDPRGVVKPLEIYIAALYWSSMTMSTIGYGDIVPSTLVERVFVSFAMLVGAFVYGYIIGAVSNVISTRNAKMNRFYQLMSELNNFLQEGKFKPDLRIRLREYFKYRLSGADVDAHTALLKQMSPALRAEITMSMNTWITKVDFFKQCPEALVIQLTMNINQQTFPPQEKILVPGDWCDKMYMVRKGVAICRQKILTTGHVFCVECLYQEGKVAYSAHAVTFVDLYWFDRNLLLDSLHYFPDMKRHFKILSLKRVFHDEVCAYAKAYKELKQQGAKADLTDKMDERPAHFLKKLRIQYGHDGAGLHDDGEERQKTKELAAKKIQQRFRGQHARIQIQAKATEEGCVGVFDPHIRKMDPQMYAARAIDVFHHRTATSLYLLHRKVDALLTGESPPPETQRHSGDATKTEGGEVNDVNADADAAMSGMYLKAERDPNTPKGQKQKVVKPKVKPKVKPGIIRSVPFTTPMPKSLKGLAGRGGAGPGAGAGAGAPPMSSPVPSVHAAVPFDSSGSASARHAAIAAEAAAAAASRGVEELRQELRQGIESIRSTGGGGGFGFSSGGGMDPLPLSSDDALGAMDRRLSRGIAAQEARASQLEVLVSDLSAQVNTMTRTLSQMSEAQRMFQERSQRTLLANLEQAQARMRDQVAKAVASGTSASSAGAAPSASGFSRPGGIGGGSGVAAHSRPVLGARPALGTIGGGLSLTESDPPPRPGVGARGANPAWAPGTGGSTGVGTLARRPLSGNNSPPAARPQPGFQQ